MNTEQYLVRSMEETVLRCMKGFPAVILSGPRQSGKTTLLRALLCNTHEYVSLERMAERQLAMDDPEAFLQAHPPPVILDEIQHVPQLMSAIKVWIDEHRREKGRFVLTGSSHLLLLEKVTESLAGRTAVLKLYPLTQRELHGEPYRKLPWESAEKKPTCGESNILHTCRDIIRGGFPEQALSPEVDSDDWFTGYIQSYLERDVRQVRDVVNLPMYQRFMQLLALRSGQLVNHSAVAHDLGITAQTARDWFAILMVTGHIVPVPPYFANVGKSLVKTGKLYFTDTGLLCHLLGIRTPEQLLYHPLAGAVFETAVFAELYKALAHRGREPRISIWRTEGGAEVDFIVEDAGRLIPIEAKFTASPGPHDARSLRRFRQDFPAAAPGWVIHAGERMGPVGEGNWGVPFGMV